MVDALAFSLLDTLLNLQLGATAREGSNRFSLDGVSVRPEGGAALVIEIQKLEVAALRLTSGSLEMEVERLVLRNLAAHVRTGEGTPRLHLLEAAGTELSGVKVHGPLSFSRESKDGADASSIPSRPRPTGDTAGGDANAWSLGPLAAAEGTIRAEIVDAHLMFDAHVTVPIQSGTVDFNEATVEHVGPDSSMGVSRLGVYVDAPNGRSYVYQFSTAPIGGVEFERRNALIGAWVADRGNLRLQPFVEGLLRQAAPGPGVGFTEDARLLFERTAVSGAIQLSDGTFAAPGVRAELAGSAEGRNAIRLHSPAVGRGVTVEIASLSVLRAALSARDTCVECGELTGALVLRVSRGRTQLRFTFELPATTISGLRLHPDRGRTV